jgi:hypothetical protein
LDRLQGYQAYCLQLTEDCPLPIAVLDRLQGLLVCYLPPIAVSNRLRVLPVYCLLLIEVLGQVAMQGQLEELHLALKNIFQPLLVMRLKKY